MLAPPCVQILLFEIILDNPCLPYKRLLNTSYFNGSKVKVLRDPVTVSGDESVKTSLAQAGKTQTRLIHKPGNIGMKFSIQTSRKELEYTSIFRALLFRVY